MPAKGRKALVNEHQNEPGLEDQSKASAEPTRTTSLVTSNLCILTISIKIQPAEGGVASG